MMLFEKIKRAYYRNQARKGKNCEKIILRGKEDEIILLWENISAEQKNDTAQLLMSKYWTISSGEIFNLINEILLKYGDEEQICRRITEYPRAYSCKDIFLKSEKVRTVFLREVPVFSAFNSDRESILFLLKLGGQEIKDFFLKYSSYVFPELAAWAIASGDKKVLDKLLFDDDVFLSEEITEMLLSSKNKDVILALAEKRLSSVGVQNILSGKYGISLTSEECENLKKKLQKLQHNEKAWSSVNAEFDMIR